ncbi:MAG: hypothetical protein O2U62_05555 [Candidatus Bathyarchaeota archaeon]|nr:hypothetical protein [Candidatus Bathyarchaeota archaeon]
MKEWMCVQVKHHNDVANAIERFQKNGWRLHTYSCVGIGIGADVNHYLLFEKGE